MPKPEPIKKEDFENAMNQFVNLMIMYTSQFESAQKVKEVNYIKAVAEYGVSGKYLVSLLHIEGEKLMYYDMDNFPALYK